MEFFHQPNIDWMGKAKYFVSLSLLLLLIGLAAGIYRHGLTYDVDFKGGTLVDVRFGLLRVTKESDTWCTHLGVINGDSC